MNITRVIIVLSTIAIVSEIGYFASQAYILSQKVPYMPTPTITPFIALGQGLPTQTPVPARNDPDSTVSEYYNNYFSCIKAEQEKSEQNNINPNPQRDCPYIAGVLSQELTAQLIATTSYNGVLCVKYVQGSKVARMPQTIKSDPSIQNDDGTRTIIMHTYYGIDQIDSPINISLARINNYWRINAITCRL